MDLQVPESAEKFLSSYTIGGFQVGLSSLKLDLDGNLMRFFTTGTQYKDIK
jgi:hypothetical protein